MADVGTFGALEPLGDQSLPVVGDPNLTEHLRSRSCLSPRCDDDANRSARTLSFTGVPVVGIGVLEQVAALAGDWFV